MDSPEQRQLVTQKNPRRNEGFDPLMARCVVVGAGALASSVVPNPFTHGPVPKDCRIVIAKPRLPLAANVPNTQAGHSSWLSRPPL